MAESDSTGESHRKTSPARRAVLRALVCGMAMAPSRRLLAQQKSKSWRVGFLAPGASSTRVYEGFRQGMRKIGLVEANGVELHWRFADGNYDRLGGLAADLVRANVDVIVAGTTLCVQAARQATATIPIIMVAVPDPVGEGFARSLSRPGGNITGLSNIVTEVSIKHVELLRAAVPRLAQLAVLINPRNPSDALILEQIHGAAYTRGMKSAAIEASTESQIEAGFGAMARARAEALIVADDAYFDVQTDRITKLAIKNRLPTICSNRDMTESGALMSYGQDLIEHYRQAATYVDRIRKGAKPASLPIEQPTVLELVLNRRTAATLGLAIPQELVLRADKLID